MKKLNLRFWQNPRFRYGSFSTLLLCISLAVLFALNGLLSSLEKKNGWRVDYSFNAFTTHSEVTQQVLDALDKPVHIYALYERGNEDLQVLELLDRYAAATGLLTWEQSPASLNPTLLTRFTAASADTAISSDALIVHCPQTDRYRVLTSTDFIGQTINTQAGTYDVGYAFERAITTAISYVSRDHVPQICIVQGQEGFNADSAATLEELLVSNHFSVQYETLARCDLDAVDLLIFLSPVVDLTEAELSLVSAYADAGGSILFTCDYSDPVSSMPNYRALLRSYGFVPRDGVVLAGKNDTDSCFNGNRTILLPDMNATDLTLNLMLGEMDVLMMPSARAFEAPYTANVEPLLYSSEGSYLHSAASDVTNLDQQPGDPVGPFPLALMSRRASQTGDVSLGVIVGSSIMLTDEYIYAMTYSQEFTMSIVNYLAGSSTLDIQVKLPIRPQLSAESVTLGSMMLVFLPLGVLAAALIVLLPRRYR